MNRRAQRPRPGMGPSGGGTFANSLQPPTDLDCRIVVPLAAARQTGNGI